MSRASRRARSLSRQRVSTGAEDKQPQVDGPGPGPGWLGAYELPEADPAVSADFFGRPPQLSAQLEALFVAFEHASSGAECAAQLCAMPPPYWYEALRRRILRAVRELCSTRRVERPLHLIVHGLLVEDKGWTTQEKVDFIFHGLHAHIAQMQDAAARHTRPAAAPSAWDARCELLNLHNQTVQQAASISFLQAQAVQYAGVIESLQWTAAHTQRQHGEAARDAEQRILSALDGIRSGLPAPPPVCGGGHLRDSAEAGEAVRALRVEAAELAAHRDAVLLERTALHGEMAAGQEQMEAMHREMAAGQEQMGVMHGEMAAGQEQMGVMHGEMAAGQEQMEVMHGEMAAGQEQMEVMHGEMAVAHNKMQAMQREMAETQREKEAMQGEMATMLAARKAAAAEAALAAHAAAARKREADEADRLPRKPSKRSVADVRQLREDLAQHEAAVAALRDSAIVQDRAVASLREDAVVQGLAADKLREALQAAESTVARLSEQARATVPKQHAETLCAASRMAELLAEGRCADVAMAKLRTEAQCTEVAMTKLRTEARSAVSTAGKLRAEGVVSRQALAGLCAEALATTALVAQLHNEALRAEQVAEELRSEARSAELVIAKLRSEARSAELVIAKLRSEARSADQVIEKLLSDAMDAGLAAHGAPCADKHTEKRPRVLGGPRKSIARLRADELSLRRSTAAVLAPLPPAGGDAGETIAALHKTIAGQEMFLNLATHLLDMCDKGPADGAAGNNATCRQEVARLMTLKNWASAVCPLCASLSGPVASYGDPQPRIMCEACSAGTGQPRARPQTIHLYCLALVCVCISHLCFAR